jgi:allophanate hydrolase
MTLFPGFTFDALRSAYAAGLSPQATVREVYRRIAEVADDGIFLHLRPVAEVLAEAENLGAFDPDRPLWGLPFAIKDNIDLAGAPTTAACPDFVYVADEDAFAVARLRAAGALAIGKTNLDQFATGLVGVRTPHPVPRNAIDPLIVPGGSSSGSAVAVAHGLVSFALGTDTAGSGRVPAALNNIVGLKPTLGALSATGVVPACRTLDTISVFALTVADAHVAFQAAAGFDPADAFSRPVPVPDLGAAPAGLRIGVPDAATREFFGDAAQAASFAATLDRLAEAGHRIVALDFTPFFEVARMLYDGAWVAERMTVVETMMRDRPEALHPVTRAIIGAAEHLSAADAFRGIYQLADLRRAAEPALAAVDLLCVPTIPTFCSLADLEADPVTPNSRLGTYTNFVNLMDLCGIAVPVAARTDGRPGSVTLLARAGQDGLAAGLAASLHARSGAMLGATKDRVPTGEALPASPDATEIELAVMGAHMTGLPLNGELTRLGARFLQATETAPAYRLYALPGGPPHRPGMVRTAEGGGAIRVETWALPLTQVGAFLAGIPSPLGLGTVTLADGRAVKGFLAEAAAVAGARDITALGGWRAFLAQAAE